MPEFFLELFSEEIPARMQAGGLRILIESLQGALAEFLDSPKAVSGFYGPRRIAVVAHVKAEVSSKPKDEKGPRTSAPEQALAGFLRKHNVAREVLKQEGEFWILERPAVTKSVAKEIAEILPIIIRSSPWPKSMRWGWHIDPRLGAAAAADHRHSRRGHRAVRSAGGRR